MNEIMNRGWRNGAIGILLLGGLLGGIVGPEIAQAQCVDYSNDAAGCQPSTFDTPIGEMPSVRVNRRGEVNAFSTESQARAGFFRLQRNLNLIRNFDYLHWVITVPSTRDSEDDPWQGGDMEGAGDARGLGIAGSCLFLGHGNGAGVSRGVDVFRIQDNPVRNPPEKIGELPVIQVGNQGYDDRELRALLYTDNSGEDRMLLVRNATTRTEGVMESFAIDPDTCMATGKSQVFDFNGPSHEFFLWHDPKNSNRVLIYMAMFAGGGLPDPADPSRRLPDAYAMGITDENSGAVLDEPLVLSTFSLEDVGGPPINERPDETGLYADGRFADFSHLIDARGRAGNFNDRQNNMLHSLSLSDDGERVYVAGGNAGFYILNSAGVANNSDADLKAGDSCNVRSTVASVRGQMNTDLLAEIANDCIHMVVSDDIGLQAFLDSGASDVAKAVRYQVLQTRSRIDVHPPNNSLPTGIHSAVMVPNRPAQVRGNEDGRPAYVWITDENFGGCPIMHARMVSTDVEATPVMVGAFAIPDNQLEECLAQPGTEPNGGPLRRVAQQNHNPTVFKNLVFNSWYGHGIRAIDISNPYMPREVGHIITLPHSIARTYPVFKDGLIYWADSDSGLHVGRYNGPRADELPGMDSGTYESNATSPHR